jgi:hypothetical protein
LMIMIWEQKELEESFKMAVLRQERKKNK